VSRLRAEAAERPPHRRAQVFSEHDVLHDRGRLAVRRHGPGARERVGVQPRALSTTPRRDGEARRERGSGTALRAVEPSGGHETMTPGHEPTGGRAHLPRRGGGPVGAKVGVRAAAHGDARVALDTRVETLAGASVCGECGGRVEGDAPQPNFGCRRDRKNNQMPDVSAPWTREKSCHSSRARGCPGDG
jgi:hypothetical protein